MLQNSSLYFAKKVVRNLKVVVSKKTIIIVKVPGNSEMLICDESVLESFQRLISLCVYNLL